MRNLDEMRRLARMARNIGQPDTALEEAIAREENLRNNLCKNLFTETTKPLENKELVEDKLFKNLPNNLPTEPPDLVQQAAEAIPQLPHAKEHKPIAEAMRNSEIAGLRQQLSDIVQRMNTLSWGGGGTGVVRFTDLDDHQQPSDIRVLEFNTAGPSFPPPAGSLTWNPQEECLDVNQPDGTTCQVGLENYIRVYNNTGGTLTQGMFVMFSGVHEPADPTEEHAPTVVGFTAGGGYPPLYTVGVLTEDILDGNYGRATTFGKVRGIDTTGTSLGETWSKGDLLWAHPTIPGALTNVQPTAPYVVVSVAAVIHAAASGEILVRPSIFPRLHYGNFYSSVDQTAAGTSTPTYVRFNNSGVGCGHVTVDGANTANVVVAHTGLYNFDFQLQVTSTNSARSNIWIWIRKNGVDVPRSASKLSVESNGGVIAPSWAWRVSMNANDVFQLMWAVDSTNVSLTAPGSTAFAPETPSATLQVTQVNL